MTAAEATAADIVGLGEHPEEIYCDAATLQRLTKNYGLAAGPDVNLVVRVPLFGGVDLLNRRALPLAAIAVDLLETADTRSRRAGLICCNNNSTNISHEIRIVPRPSKIGPNPWYSVTSHFPRFRTRWTSFGS